MKGSVSESANNDLQDTLLQHPEGRTFSITKLQLNRKGLKFAFLFFILDIKYCKWLILLALLVLYHVTDGAKACNFII
jgi:hypothetical protein